MSGKLFGGAGIGSRSANDALDAATRSKASEDAAAISAEEAAASAGSINLTWSANTINKADVDDTPIELVFALDTMLGRFTGVDSGVLTDLTAPEIRAFLNVQDGATDDQTEAEIKIAYEGNTNTNAFTDTEQSKLTGIEAGATADQTGAEIKAAYEGEANTNPYTDAEQTKLGVIEDGATADQTGDEMVTALATKTLDDIKFTDYGGVKVDHATPGATEDIDVSLGDYHVVNLDANLTISFSNFKPDSTVIIEYIQDTTDRTVTHPAEVDFGDASIPAVPSGTGKKLIVVYSTRDTGTIVQAAKFWASA